MLVYTKGFYSYMSLRFANIIPNRFTFQTYMVIETTIKYFSGLIDSNLKVLFVFLPFT